MSEKRVKETERRLRYRRLRHQLPYQQGVSPVVATLILILIAVAAAAALYLWLVGWQGSVTGSISKPGVNQGTFSIGGSTSVYPFDELAVTQYQQNNSGVTISDTEGGTGAGMLAVCAGAVDVGTASTPETAQGLIASDGCPEADASTITVTTVAYDAVDVIVDGSVSGGPHGLQSISYDTLTLIYDRASTTTATLVTTTMNGKALPAGFPTGALEWENIPAAVSNQVVYGVTEQLALGYSATVNVAATAGGGGDIVTPTTDDSPCGWTICAGPFNGTTGTDLIQPVERSDASGTTQTFEARILGATADNAFATSFTDLGYSGCGSNNLLSDCGISVSTQESGNPGVLSYIADHPDSIGYASDGLARVTANIGTNGIVPFESVGQSAAVEPTTGASGSIASGINAIAQGTAPAGAYSGVRPFEYVTLAPPTGLVESFISWVLQPGVNSALATESYEVSIYSI